MFDYSLSSEQYALTGTTAQRPAQFGKPIHLEETPLHVTGCAHHAQHVVCSWRGNGSDQPGQRHAEAQRGTSGSRFGTSRTAIALKPSLGRTGRSNEAIRARFSETKQNTETSQATLPPADSIRQQRVLPFRRTARTAAQADNDWPRAHALLSCLSAARRDGAGYPTVAERRTNHACVCGNDRRPGPHPTRRLLGPQQAATTRTTLDSNTNSRKRSQRTDLRPQHTFRSAGTTLCRDTFGVAP